MAGPHVSTVLGIFEALRITHVVGIPDNATAPLFDRLANHARIRLVTVTREGEAFAIASGIWLGRGAPFVAIQNTGLLESGDALRGTAVRMGVPLPILVAGRGYAKLARAPAPSRSGWTRDLLVRADLDSVALLTEPTLDAWGIPFVRVAAEADADNLRTAIERSRDEERPVAAVLTTALTA